MKNRDKGNNFALYLLFSEAIAFNQDEIKERIARISDTSVSVKSVVGLDGQEKKLYVHINVDGEAFDLLGIEGPLPQNIMNYTVECGYGNPELLEAMRQHQFHVVAFYKGENENRQQILDAYKKLAYGFISQGLIGLANPYSWNTVSAELIQAMVEDEETSSFAKTPAMMIWRNFIRLQQGDKTWFVTKGNHLFGVNELAYLGPEEEAQNVYDILETIFSYVYEESGSIAVGDTLQMGEQEVIEFKSLQSVPEQMYNLLKGEAVETLIIEKRLLEQ